MNDIYELILNASDINISDYIDKKKLKGLKLEPNQKIFVFDPKTNDYKVRPYNVNSMLILDHFKDDLKELIRIFLEEDKSNMSLQHNKNKIDNAIRKIDIIVNNPKYPQYILRDSNYHNFPRIK